MDIGCWDEIEDSEFLRDLDNAMDLYLVPVIVIVGLAGTCCRTKTK